MIRHAVRRRGEPKDKGSGEEEQDQETGEGVLQAEQTPVPGVRQLFRKGDENAFRPHLGGVSLELGALATRAFNG